MFRLKFWCSASRQVSVYQCFVIYAHRLWLTARLPSDGLSYTHVHEFQTTRTLDYVTCCTSENLLDFSSRRVAIGFDATGPQNYARLTLWPLWCALVLP